MRLKYLLLPLTPVFRSLVAARNFGFRVGCISTSRLPVPVISVGNLTFGGTGKTPTVISLVRELVRRGQRPAVLTRGYRRKDRRPTLIVGPDSTASAERVGDEALEMATRLPGVPIAIDGDRVRGGREALRRGASVIVMDDGFQHRRLARDLDLVLIDAGDPWGGGRLPPLGRLREPIKGLVRADAAIITKLPADSEGRFADLRQEIASIAPSLPVFGARLVPTGLISPEGRQSVECIANRRVVAMAGLGRPSGFVEALKDIDAQVVEQLFFRDHHHFDQADVDSAIACASQNRAILVTTAKDAAKLPRGAGHWILEVEMVPNEGSWDDVLDLCSRG
ncbi:MAG: tetraacyldisaccharide 4'-kinase [bacterium]|nr:tetraacyldisaccharide 4'-kinase [bacterium]